MKRYVVVGDLSGVGYGVAEALVAMGYDVYGRTKEGQYYEHSTDNISETGSFLANGEPIRKVNTAYDKAPEDVDCVIDSGCINKQSWASDEDAGEVFMELMENNNKKMYDLYHDFIDDLRSNKGIFLTVASVAARFPMSCTSAYNSSKAAMVMQSRVFAREEHRKVQDDYFCSFITVSPILIPETNMIAYLKKQYVDQRLNGDMKGKITREELQAQTDAHWVSELTNRTPLKLADVVKFIVSLVTDQWSLCRSISGSDLQIGSQI